MQDSGISGLGRPLDKETVYYYNIERSRRFVCMVYEGEVKYLEGRRCKNRLDIVHKRLEGVGV